MADTELKEKYEVSEEERQIEGFHNALHALFKGASDEIIARSCASFMGCILAHTEEWKRIIPGFVNEVIAYADVAIAAHRQAEKLIQPELNLGDADACKKES